MELLQQSCSLSAELRVPAISRLQKIHNVGLAFRALTDKGVDVEKGWTLGNMESIIKAVPLTQGGCYLYKCQDFKRQCNA